MTVLSSLLSASAVLAQVPAERHPVVDLFVSACIDGQVSLLRSNAREIARSDLPPLLRSVYRRAGPLRYFALNQPQRAYLITGSEGREREYSRSICAVAAPGLDLRQAHDQVWEVIWGTEPSPLPDGLTPVRYAFSNYDEEYTFTANDYGTSWVALQISHPGERAMRRFRAEGRRAEQRFRARARRPVRPRD